MGWNHFTHRVATVLRNVADRIDPQPAPLVWWNPEHTTSSTSGTVRIRHPGHDS